MKSKNNTTTNVIEIDTNGKVINDSQADAELVRAELSREHLCCLNMAIDCTGCGECNGRVI